MQYSHYHWLNQGHSFLLPKCVLGKLLVHLLMCLFGDIILCHWIGDTACCCGRGEVWVPAMYSLAQKVCVAYMHALMAGCKSSPKRVIHYSLSVHAQFLKWPWKLVRQNQTSWTACYGHEPEVILQPYWSIASTLNDLDTRCSWLTTPASNLEH